MNENEEEFCFSILCRCDKFSEDFGIFPEVHSLILNNFGCYFRRKKENQVAINYFENALNLLIENDCLENRALTHLNLSAINSQISK